MDRRHPRPLTLTRVRNRMLASRDSTLDVRLAP
jgi:hypothetical protein